MIMVNCNRFPHNCPPSIAHLEDTDRSYNNIHVPNACFFFLAQHLCIFPVRHGAGTPVEAAILRISGALGANFRSSFPTDTIVFARETGQFRAIPVPFPSELHLRKKKTLTAGGKRAEKEGGRGKTLESL